MKKQTLYGLLGAALLLTGASVRAEAWEVSVTVSYFTSKNKLVSNEKVLNFIVPVGECVKGITRNEQMIHAPLKLTQEICIYRVGGEIKLSGLVFANKRILDTDFNATRAALNYGAGLRAETDGNMLRFNTGPYEVTAFRNGSF